MAEQTRSTQTEDEQASSEGEASADSSPSTTSEDGSSSGQAWTAEASAEQTSSGAAPSEQDSADLRSGEQGSGQRQSGQESAERDSAEAPRGRERRAPLDVGEVVWKVAGILATVVRVVGFVLAAVLVIFIVLAVVGVNTQNGVAQVIGGIGDTVVLGFRDLFLLADPVFAVVVNYGLAAVFWALVAEFGSRLIRFVGARLS